ncbi:hypothetical protein INT43_006171 [Umbelopsis isabellina]|uniref:OTU domain-containing protein n=1 Tax=Mortierella isabellina TaxID=91625 RepID=A0A8H7PZU1_MORIS|nr:hypothetical protein INT43_006171 [Umbelopsis isabellina]
MLFSVTVGVTCLDIRAKFIAIDRLHCVANVKVTIIRGMNNDEDLYKAVSDALKDNNVKENNGFTAEAHACPYETLEEILARHRREIRQLNADTTALKKTATKGEKKKKKDILTKVAIMEDELNKRHEEELRKHKLQPGDPDNVETAVDEEDDGISLDRLNELTIEEGPIAPTGTPSIGANGGRKKPNRQKLRKERKEAEIQKMKDEAEKEADGQVDRGKLESDAIKELLVPMRLRVSEVPADGHCLYNAVADQLAKRYKVQTDYKKLRKEAANYIRSHPDDFIPFLYKDDGGMYTEEDLKNYCDDLENTAVWGGQIEVSLDGNLLELNMQIVLSQRLQIMALSKVEKVPFYIIQMGSPVLKISEEDFPAKPPIKLAVKQSRYHKHLYSLGEHYNSLLDI